jgi:hypothetical protein
MPPRPRQRTQSTPVPATLVPVGKPSGTKPSDGESKVESPDGREECGSATAETEPAGI